MFTIVATQHSLRRSRKFLKQHTEIKERFAQVIDDLKRDPFAPHLAYHHLAGNLKGVRAVSITNSYPMTLTLLVADKEITLLDIGDHDEVYR